MTAQEAEQKFIDNMSTAENIRLQAALSDTVLELQQKRTEKARLEKGCTHYLEESLKWHQGYVNEVKKKDLQIIAALCA